MFNLKKVAAAGALLAATCVVPLCEAQTVNVKVLTAGSSAQWGVFAKAAQALAQAQMSVVPGGTVHHCTINGPVLHDNRTPVPTPSVPDESGKIWVVWTNDGGSPAVENVWAFLSVDSVVGVRAYMAAPRDTVVFSGTSCGNLLSPPSAALFNQVDDASLGSLTDPTSVASALNHHILTAANTDIRPEDALFATLRSIRALDTTSYNGLGIGTNNPVTDTSSAAHVVPFALTGTDPFSGDPVSAFATEPIGAAPAIFLVNTSMTGAGHLGDPAITNINNGLQGTPSNAALAIFSGGDCNSVELGATAPNTSSITAFLREPTSGTMNTVEYTNFRLSPNHNTSQEKDATYPGMLNVPCAGGGGHRTREIGTGDEVNGVKGQADGIGYAFYSIEAVPNGTAAAPGTPINYKYLSLNGQDPLSPAVLTAGTFPICGSNTAYFCQVINPSNPISGSPAFDQFDSLRNGSYTSWTMYRAVVAPGTTEASNMQQLIDVSQSVVDSALPDFVPYAPHCSGDSLTPASVTSGTVSFTDPNGIIPSPVTTYAADEPGLEVFRSHFQRAGFSPANGQVIAPNSGSCSSGVQWIAAFVGDASASGGTAESGGDVGGTILPTPAQGGPMNATPSATVIGTVNSRQ